MAGVSEMMKVIETKTTVTYKSSTPKGEGPKADFIIKENENKYANRAWHYRLKKEFNIK